MLDADPRSADAGVWCTMFFIYMTYTLLALHVEECTVSGLLLGFTQVGMHFSFTTVQIIFLWLYIQQERIRELGDYPQIFRRGYFSGPKKTVETS